MNQLSWIIVGGSSGTADEQAAAPDEQGGYGGLMDEIDRLLSPRRTSANGPRRKEPDSSCLLESTGRTVSPSGRSARSGESSAAWPPS
jgi:hypothetical protein